MGISVRPGLHQCGQLGDVAFGEVGQGARCRQFEVTGSLSSGLVTALAQLGDLVLELGRERMAAPWGLFPVLSVVGRPAGSER